MSWFTNDVDTAELRDLPHRLILSNPRRAVGRKNSNGKVLVVRCTCMSQVHRPSPRFTGYDWLAQVSSLHEAIVAWKQHVAECEST